jgi:hypothetical protein
VAKDSGEIITITVINWDKYNGSKKRGDWFKFHHDFFMGKLHHRITGSEFRVYIWILSQCSLSNNSVLTRSQLDIKRGTSEKQVSINSALQKLQDAGTIKFSIASQSPRVDQNRVDQNRSYAAVSTKPTAPPLDLIKKGNGKNTQHVIAAYCDAYSNRYKIKRPTLDGKAIGILKRLTTSLGAERMVDLCQAFLQMNDQWFETKAHDVATLEQNITKIGAALDSGKDKPGKRTLREELEEGDGTCDVRKICESTHKDLR